MPATKSKQQHDVQRVQKQIGVVVTGRIELKELVIQSVSKPGQGMPVGRIEGGERPCDRPAGQTPFHVDVIGYILVVIVIDERVVMDWEVKRQRCADEQEAEKRY